MNLISNKKTYNLHNIFEASKSHIVLPYKKKQPAATFNAGEVVSMSEGKVVKFNDKSTFFKGVVLEKVKTDDEIVSLLVSGVVYNSKLIFDSTVTEDQKKKLQDGTVTVWINEN